MWLWKIYQEIYILLNSDFNTASVSTTDLYTFRKEICLRLFIHFPLHTHTHTHNSFHAKTAATTTKNPNTNFPCLLWKSLDTSEYSESNYTTMYSTDRCTQLSYDQFVQSVREPRWVTTLNQLCFFFDLQPVPWIIAGLNFLFYVNIMDITIYHNVFSSVQSLSHVRLFVTP